MTHFDSCSISADQITIEVINSACVDSTHSAIQQLQHFQGLELKKNMHNTGNYQ